MNFSFEKSAVDAARRGFRVMLIVNAFLVPGSFYMLYKQKNAGSFMDSLNMFLAQAGVFTLLIVNLACFFLFYKLMKSTGSWLISVSDSEVIWNVPRGSGEQSFRAELHEIERIVEEVYKSDFDSSYRLFTRGGNAFSLGLNSGINMDKFIRTLEFHGVKYEREYKN